MLIFRNPAHHSHDGRHEMFRGRLVPCHETPARLDYVMAELQRRPVGELGLPGPVDLDLVRRVHSPAYIDFLKTVWDDWVALDASNVDLDVLPSVWPVRDFVPTSHQGTSRRASGAFPSMPVRRSRPVRGPRRRLEPHARSTLRERSAPVERVLPWR